MSRTAQESSGATAARGDALRRELAQLLDLGGLELPVPAGREVAQAQRAEGDALQAHHGVPDGVEHPPHLPLAALVQRDLDALGREPARARGRRHPVVEEHALAQPAQRGLAHRRAADVRAVDAR